MAVMQFHKLHGKNITLLEENTVATRGNGFSGGICFSSEPIKPFQLFLVEIKKNVTGYADNMRIGLTKKDPNKVFRLPQSAIPGLTAKGDSWVYPIGNATDKIYGKTIDSTQSQILNFPKFADDFFQTNKGLIKKKILFPENVAEVTADDENKTKAIAVLKSEEGATAGPYHMISETSILHTDPGSRIGLMYSVKNNMVELHLIINGEDIGACPDDIVFGDSPLYAVIDVFGTTKEVAIVQLEEHTMGYDLASDMVSLLAVKEIARSYLAKCKVMALMNTLRQLHFAEQETKEIALASCDHRGLQAGDLSFKEGDEIEIIKDGSSGDNDWWMAKLVKSGKKGYVHRSFIVNAKIPEAQSYWFPVNRRQAERLLLDLHPKGTFLVRPSSIEGKYVISVRDTSDVHHFLIEKEENGVCTVGEYPKAFQSIAEMVRNFQENEDKHIQLSQPCPREPVVIPFRDIEVDNDSIEMIVKLGNGCFGEVWRGTWRKQFHIAVKTLKETTISNEEFTNEAKVMHKLRHPRLVQLMGVCTKSTPLLIITEYMANGSLYDHLQKDKGDTIKLPQIVKFAYQVADGMSFLEEHNYVHRDLRAENVLVGENYKVKIADFGLARMMSPVGSDDCKKQIYKPKGATCFPIKWTPPEAAMHGRFSTKSDVWSFGILLYEIVTYGAELYDGLGFTPETLMMGLILGVRLQKPTGKNIDCPDWMYDIMLECWKLDPERRPAFDSLVGEFYGRVEHEPDYSTFKDMKLLPKN